MATPRRLLVDPAKSGVFHCVSRCVRRAFLCGQDAYSGRDYEHRRSWIRDRLCELTDFFAVEVFSYAVMSNHLHLVVRTRPELVASYDDEEIARRWLRLFPGNGGERGQPPGDDAIRALCKDTKRLADCRVRLADLSWFMRALNEPIARRANREDDCTGRFWEGRFKCQKLDDEGATLACMAYVDLNPVRAGIAATPEASEFTSGQDRALACIARQQLTRAPQNPTPQQAQLIRRAEAESRRDGWLAPIGLRQPSPADPHPLLARVSEEHYLELLDWTGRQIREGKRGRVASHLSPVLERLELDVEVWVDNVEGYGGLFYRLAGKLKRLKELAGAHGSAWLHGHGGARRLYVPAR